MRCSCQKQEIVMCFKPLKGGCGWPAEAAMAGHEDRDPLAACRSTGESLVTVCLLVLLAGGLSA